MACSCSESVNKPSGCGCSSFGMRDERGGIDMREAKGAEEEERSVA